MPDLIRPTHDLRKKNHSKVWTLRSPYLNYLHQRQLLCLSSLRLRERIEWTSPGHNLIFRISRVTLKIVKEAKELGIPALWLQPGAEDDEVKRYVEEADLGDKVILGGPCILVDGPSVLRSLLWKIIQTSNPVYAMSSRMSAEWDDVLY